MVDLSIGKLRNLQQCSTNFGVLAVLALDHRNNLHNALNPAAPDSVSTEEMTIFKMQVVSEVAPAASAVLLDPEIGGAQCIAAGVLPGMTGLIMAVEATGYTGDPTARKSQLLPGWSVANGGHQATGLPPSASLRATAPRLMRLLAAPLALSVTLQFISQ